MISAIKGNVFDISPGEVHIDIGNGLIVKVLCPVSTYSNIKAKDQVLLYTVLRQKDEEFFLYGFLSKKEKMLFKKMTSISGIGGKTALCFISAFSIDEFIQAVEKSDVLKLSSVPGIGKKTAQRIILELTGKIDFKEYEIVDKKLKLKEDLVSGLVNLGYPLKPIREFVNKTLKENPEENSFGILFKLVLKKISRK